ncbi:MAG: calcium-binding protein [Pseudomonadota bacterium]
MTDLMISLAGEDGGRLDFTDAGEPIFSHFQGGAEDGAPALSGPGVYTVSVGESVATGMSANYPPPPDPQDPDAITPQWLAAAAATPAETITIGRLDLGFVGVLTFPNGGALSVGALIALTNEGLFAGNQTVTVAPSLVETTLVMDLGTGDDVFVARALGRNVIEGGAGDDDLVGGAAGDVLRGDDGRDRLVGDGGADKLYGGARADDLIGDQGPGPGGSPKSAGADLLRGGGGRDTLEGGGRGDRLFGDSGNDRLEGEGGNDKLFGGTGKDAVFGGKGGDDARGGAGADRMIGAAGGDELDGDGGKDALFGGAGGDRLRGGAGADRLEGGGGDDALLGGLGDDMIFGGGGNDVVSTSKGRDVVKLGDGRDTLAIDPRGGLGKTVVKDFGRQDDVLLPDVGGTPQDLLIEIAVDTARGVRLNITDTQWVLLEGWRLGDFFEDQVDFI